LRAQHGSPDLVFDHDIAKAAQAMLATKACAAGLATPFAGSLPADRPYKYKDCEENYYYTSNQANLMESDAATDKWYQGHLHWDYDNGQPKTSSSADRRVEASRFSRMIWKGVNFEEGTKPMVGFGIQCGFALAW
jgi:hypothetical protein